MSLIVTGSIGLDTVTTPDGETVTDILGGSAIFFAAGASFFLPDGGVRLVAAVGDDFPDHHLTQFEQFKVDTAGLERRAGSKTFRWHGKYHEDMNERDTLSIDLGVLAEELPAVPEAFRDSKYVFLAVTNPENQLALMEQFPQRKVVVADTIDLYINTDRANLIKVIESVDGFIINDAEARLLTGETDLVQTADAILAMGPTFAVVKKGEHGALLAVKSKEEGRATLVALPAYPSRKVVDPTGAGDSFAAGMMGFLAAHPEEAPLDAATLKRAMAYGTMVASYTIEGHSVAGLEGVTKADLDARLEQYITMLHLDAVG